MGPLVSRVLVALVGVPVVLLIVWAGGWWLFALAGVAAVLALHEYSLMIRTLRPVILAAYTGALLSLLGAQLGGLDWTAAGLPPGLVRGHTEVPSIGKTHSVAGSRGCSTSGKPMSPISFGMFTPMRSHFAWARSIR